MSGKTISGEPARRDGRYEEAVSVAGARRRGASDTGVRVVVLPWSDHALEPWEPVLVDAIGG